MKQLATVIGEKNAEKAALLWNRLSSKWIHFTGYVNEMSKAWIPPYVPVYVINTDEGIHRISKSCSHYKKAHMHDVQHMANKSRGI